MHCRRRTVRGRHLLGGLGSRGGPAWKRARGGAGLAGTPHALAKDGLPRERNSRPPDAGALLYSALEGKVGQRLLLTGTTSLMR